MRNIEIRNTQPNDKTTLADVLKRAFAKDPVMRWILPATDDYERISYPFFTLILGQTLASGISYTTDEQLGVSLWEKPDHSPSMLSQLLSFARFSWLFRGNVSRAVNLQNMMASYRPGKPFWHLTYIATDPDHQGKGIGTNLLQPIRDQATQDDYPIYLECSNRDNLAFYRRHGFRLVDELRSPTGPTIWPMIMET
ncbi:MAG TPA: GNAT family N-acetyltransferase [Pseudomonadales bacterium]|jgi:GNAT superfamily N-acetyltransferase|nr:GNAT family N-acetyltransferase [Pseudomonadales bacterium]MDP7313270.1 GNAT family N-acetyltransferase [Pseudomonadales bacterium]HJP51190.1 GNAT family N-acetyltransferase [Pseudomonadales bacterium]|tara:strand:+ start:2385 stop:2972 length:588 start_codon:yes stop_codon:yes gene_type:complete